MLSLDNIEKFLLNDWTIQIIFACAISVTRLSLLMFYHRLFPVKRFTIVAVITGCIMIGWWISFMFAIVFSCYPVASYWNKAIVGQCINEHTLSWGITGSELGANIIMLVLPIPWLWDLRLARAKKLALVGIFTLGCFVCISCIVRFPLLAAVVQTDASWTIIPAGIWIAVECNIGIASVCLPLMRPLIHVEFSNISTYFSLSRSRRTDSPFSDEEMKMEASSGLRSIGKLCEKPYDGPCPAPVIAGRPRHSGPWSPETTIHGSSDSGCKDPSRPLINRGYRDVRTHRSRIESYSPEKLETSDSDSPNAHLTLERKTMRSSVSRDPRKLHNVQSPPKHNPTRSSPPPKPRHGERNDFRQEIAIINPLKAHPPSIHKTPRHNSQHDLLKAHWPSLHRSTKKPRHRSAPMTLPIQKPTPRHASPPVPAAPSTLNLNRRNRRRLTVDEMNERWRMWYEGRGSEVGRGLWSLEIVASPRARGEEEGIPWDSGQRRETQQLAPRSRL
ncbi:MAG: hypothetical protein LQ338_005839 [Usnochroma carphineum]|nr:MAG: hypothetical protein LQ338_005839 [Usnochroma carphineum]